MRIAVLEDDAAQLALLCAWLREADYDVHAFPLTKELLRFASRESVDLYLLDWRVPDMSGQEFLHWLRDERRDLTPAIFITALDDEDSIVAGLDSGADDYLSKPVAKRVLMSRIDAVMRRYTQDKDEAEIVVAPYLIDFTRKQISLRDEVIELTDKEFEVAAFLFRNLGRLLSRGHLLKAVWGRNPDLATRTVDTHVSRVRSKLVLRPENGFRLTPAYNYGYRLERCDPTALDEPEAV